LNIGGGVDVIDCSGTSRAALASFRRSQIATSVDLGPFSFGHSGTQIGMLEPIAFRLNWNRRSGFLSDDCSIHIGLKKLRLAQW
jgi:hypothetical protein